MPVGRHFSDLKILGRNQVMIGGIIVTDTIGDVSQVVTKGAGFTVEHFATGVYRVHLGRSVDKPDRYQGIITGFGGLVGSNARGLRVAEVFGDVTALAPYVDITVHTIPDASAATLAAGGYPHGYSPLALAISAADASDLPTLKTLCKDICDVFDAHQADVGLHFQASGELTNAAYVSSPAEPANLAECMGILIEAKGDWNTHITQIAVPSSDVHYGADPRAVVGAANAVDQGTAETLANEIKWRFNRSITAQPTEVVNAAADVIAGAIFFAVVLSTSEVS
jgi:hypothetical protein